MLGTRTRKAVPADFDAIKHAASAAMDGGSTVVVALEGDVVHDLVRDALAATGLAVRSIQRATASLEDVYLRSSEAAPPRLPRP